MSIFSVADKAVIVTGGSRGVGAAVVRILVGNGANVAIFDILDKPGQDVAAQASSAGPGRAIYYHVDISSREEVFEGVQKAFADLGRLDSLHNIAGVERSSPAEDIKKQDLDLILDVNVKGTFYMAQAVFPYLKELGGTIINFGSDAGLSPYVGGAHYSLSKGAIHSLTRTLAHEWGKYGIRANAVLPAVWTEMYDEHRSCLSLEELQHHDDDLAKRVPLGGRLGSPSHDLAPVMVFLTSDASKFITGQMVSVNGGLGSVR
ncbi:short-chain dehydrogenase/reductase SDR [Diaporthe sp. PMI_573]|nr:short-chain dehydrogenase/reductase SDR [Diaporthaceae sp. PMI_573]